MPETAPPKWMTWGGRVLTALPALMLAVSGALKLRGGQQVVEAFTGTFGFRAASLTPIGLLELGCTALYLVPRTSVLGAVLLTGYLGGAVVTHVRIGDNPLGPVLVGVLVWGGLFLRDARIRALLPLRRAS
jgi:hypothetical protein